MWSSRRKGGETTRRGGDGTAGTSSEIKRGLKWNEQEVTVGEINMTQAPGWPSSDGKGRKGKPIVSVGYGKERKKNKKTRRSITQQFIQPPEPVRSRNTGNRAGNKEHGGWRDAHAQSFTCVANAHPPHSVFSGSLRLNDEKTRKYLKKEKNK